jgi:DNA-binding NarL/FixJ family response regulator
METRPTVVIVDDHAGFRAQARTVLEAEGFEVVGEAADGASAVEEVTRLVPDVALVDVQLPDMDGFEVATRLREAGATARVVLTSSRDGSDFGSLVERSGALGFIAKAELSGEALGAIIG